MVTRHKPCSSTSSLCSQCSLLGSIFRLSLRLHTVDEIGWKKCLPKNVGHWVVTGVYWVLSRTGFWRRPLYQLLLCCRYVNCVEWGAHKLNCLYYSAPPYTTPTIDSARKVSIRRLPGSGQASFFSTRSRTWARQQPGIERQPPWKCGQLPPAIDSFLVFPDSSQSDSVCLSVWMTTSSRPWRRYQVTV